ncbi:MAG: hypothetical protein LBV40_07780 [Methanomicrobiales archaeon]|jgi:cytochrome c biogenesis protein CcdA|nr:hypothetical protein [Methanomicrobiales archaeon]
MRKIQTYLSIVFFFLILSCFGVYADIFNSDGQTLSSDEIDAVLVQATPADAKYVYIYSATCSDCAQVSTWLEGFFERHPDIVVERHDISLLESRVLFEEYKLRFNAKFPSVPIIFVGNLIALEGVEAITTHFEPISVRLSELVVQDGGESSAPVIPSSVPTITQDGSTSPADENKISFLLQVTSADVKYIYIYSATCANCAKVKEWLEGFHERHPDIIVEYHDLSLPETMLLLEEYKGRFNKPFLSPPIIFVGDLIALEGVEAIRTHFEPFAVDLAELAANDVPKIYTATVTTATPPSAVSSSEIPLLLIIGAGLLDGINPCAFAVLVLLLGYLMSVDSRRKMVLGGLIYTSAVFIFYYIAGLLLTRSVQMAGIAEHFSKFAGILSILFGLVMIKGVFFPGKGPVLAIPESQKPRIDRWMKKGTLPSIFVLGVLVGMFELPCTGGIYLAIISMISLQTDIYGGLFYLLLYNIAFILPLLIILIAVCYGIPPEKVDEWRLERRLGLRLIIGIIMILLGIVILTGILY